MLLTDFVLHKFSTYHVCNIQIKFVPPIIFVIHHILHTCKKKRAPVLRALGLSLACRAPFLCKLKNSDRADVLCSFGGCFECTWGTCCGCFFWVYVLFGCIYGSFESKLGKRSSVGVLC